MSSNIVMSLLKLKRNILVLKDNFDEYQQSFFTSLENSNESGTYYDICQNDSSLPLLFSSLFYEDATSCFFLEAINFYQNLESKSLTTTIPYFSYSQSFTTYGLKLLERQHLIEIVKCNRDKSYNLDTYESLFGSCHDKEVAMYSVFFYKLRDLQERDLPFLKSLAKALHVDFSQYEIFYENEKMFFGLKKSAKIKNIFSSGFISKILIRKDAFFYIGTSIKEELLRDVFSGRKLKKNKNKED